MSNENECLRQSYNPRSKKWVLIDCSAKGGIKKMQAEKFEGIPIKNGRGENEPTDTPPPGESKQENGNDNTAAAERKPTPPAEKTGNTRQDNSEDRKRRRFLF